jgi:hypothetical protein
MTWHRSVACQVLAACVITAALATATTAVGASVDPAGEVDRALLAQARRATAQFHDVRRAEAAGYLPTEHCVADPELGGMGYHYINPSLVFDGGIVEATRPEVLLYAPSPNGRLRLVGVEYLVPAADWSAQEAPDLFGIPFDGPMEEHDPGTTGDHYDQHAWIWTQHPEGILATWNTAVSCNPHH